MKMLNPISMFRNKSVKIHPAKPDPCESIYVKWTQPNAYDACKLQYAQYLESLKERSNQS